MPNPEMRSIGRESTAIKTRLAGGLNYLFVIAIDNYQDSRILDPESGKLKPTFPNLRNPVLDADRFVTVLLDKYTFDNDAHNSRLLNGYPEEVVEYNTLRTKCLYNERATGRNITTHLRALANTIKPADSLLIYFAGHGDDDDINPSGCFIPFDGVGDPTESNTWFNFLQLYSLFKFPKCLDVFLILDCCFAGRAALGVSNRVAGFFSRHVLVSASPQQKAADGEPYQGSPFANALCYILKENTFPYATLDEKALKARFRETFVRMYEEEPKQDILYETLPTDCGEGDFIFELKVKDTPSPDVLTDQFVRFLNFSQEKSLLAKKFNRFSTEGEHIIVVRNPDKYIHELLRAVVFTRLSEFDNLYGCAMKLGACMRKSLPLDVKDNFDIWETLCASFDIKIIRKPGETPDSAAAAVAESVAAYVVNLLLEKPLAISFYSDHLTKNFTKNILAFCQTFSDALKEAKEKRRAATKWEETYHKLFFIIPDARDSGAEFFKEEEMTALLQNRYHVIINDPGPPLELVDTVDWFRQVKAVIGAQNIQALTAMDFFPNPAYTYPSVLDFIYSVCDKVKVDKPQVQAAILNY